MGCLVGCFALLFPRATLIAVWLLGPAHYLSAPFPGIAYPILGFLFVPTTTLAYAFAEQTLAQGGPLTPLGWVLVAIGLLVDAGLLRGGHGGYRHHQRERERQARERATRRDQA